MASATDDWGQGGGLYFEDCDVVVTGNRVCDNSASAEWEGWGGGVSIIRGRAAISTTDVLTNYAASEGGGLHIYGANVAVHDCEIISNTAENGRGGGLLAQDSVVTVTNSLFLHNSANSGGGGGMGVWNTEALVDGNEFRNNDVTDEAGGGFVGSWGSVVTVANNLIADNTATGSGGGMGVYWDTQAWIAGNHVHSNSDASAGGGIVAHGYCQVAVAHNTVYSNTAPTGGGISMWHISHAQVISNVIEGNSATDRGGGGILIDYGSGNRMEQNVIRHNDAQWGGGLHLYETDFVLSNNVVVDNCAQDSGGGMYPSSSDGNIVNNTVAQNEATTGGGLYAYCLPTQTITITNSIFWDDAGGELSGNGYVVSYSDVEGGAVGTSNIAADPMFVDPGAGDYHLPLGSPGVDTGTAAGAPADDFEGDPRPWGFGVDMGADEFAGHIVDPGCYDFLDPVGVGVEDVQFVADHWRWPAEPPYDADGDGVITVVDIMRVAADWGDLCP
jgi:parallel beta-helix repeat protein